MNVKLFNNGSIQITGCTSLRDCNIGLNKLINRLKETYSYIDENNNFVDIKFVSNIDNILVTKMKIDMINSNFTINYNINRETLYNLLRNDLVICRYNPSSHACVNIKFKSSNDHKVSIFVFQTGKIIITGAKMMSQINEAYNYIYVYLQKNRSKILKKDISKLLNNNDYILQTSLMKIKNVKDELVENIEDNEDNEDINENNNKNEVL
jgi:TATA-box binding protein (TBP) (component of TFIID and TFIIIB)